MKKLTSIYLQVSKGIFQSFLLLLLSLSITNTLSAQNVTTSFSFTGVVDTWTVPPGVTSIEMEVIGGDGGDGNNHRGGSGAKAIATFAVTPGTVLEIVVGEAGASSTVSGGGGGGSGVRVQGATTPLMVAGAGAGAGANPNVVITSLAGGGGLATTGNGNGGADGGLNSSGGGGGILTAGMTDTSFGSSPGQGGLGGFGVSGGMGFSGNGNGGFGVGGGGGGGNGNLFSGSVRFITGGGGGGGYSGGDAALTLVKIPGFSTGGGSFISPSASSFMPIVAGVMGGNADPAANGLVLFHYALPTVAQIPTFNQWGLFIFGLLILNLGLIFMVKLKKVKS